MKKIIFLVIILLFAISSARLTIGFMGTNDSLFAALSLLLTVIFGAFFVQEVSSWERELRTAKRR